MKYLKYFETAAEYTQFKNTEVYVLPNVSFVKEIRGVKYERKKPKKSYTLLGKYNATSDNLVAFTGATNVKALNVNGTSIKVEPIKNEIFTFDVLGENISMNLETGEATLPESYLVKSPVSSWTFKAKDPNYVINENTYICYFNMWDGVVSLSPELLVDEMGYSFTTNDGVTLEVVGEFLDYISQSGEPIGFTLVDIDLDSETFTFIDTEHQTNIITGGISTYSFDGEGTYDVKIELADPTIKMSFAETSLTSIEISNDITSIGDDTFYNCSSLTSITIPDSVTTIGNFAFCHCSSLTSVTIPNNVTSIGLEVFYGCSSLTSVTIPDNVTSIGDGAFYYCSSLTSVTIPDSVISIGKSAFYDCSSLASITIPDSVTSIEDYTFYGCNSLTSITIPDSVTSIGARTFYDCRNLTSVTIGNSVTSIGYNAFSDCRSLTSVYCKAITPPALGNTFVFDSNGSGRKIYVPAESVDAYKSARYWNEYASAIVGYDFENGTIVSDYKLEYTSTDNSIVSPYSTKGFNEDILANVYKNGKGVIYFDNPITSIGDDTFYNCSSLTSITIPDSVTSIGDYAFQNCSSLTSVTIPDSVISIGGRAFSGCSSLQEINGKYASEDGRCLIVDGTLNSFASAGLTEYTISDGVTSIGNYAFDSCYNLTSVTIPESVTSIENYAFYNCSSLTSVTIGNSVTTIGEYAFQNCSSLTSVTIPDSVTSIGYRAFSGCTGELIINSKVIETNYVSDPSWLSGAKFTKLTIGNSVTSIGKRAFYGCSSLTSVTIGDSVMTIGERAFHSCTNLTSVIIPNSVTVIGTEAFKECKNLTSVTIPNSVTSIQYGAFTNCSNLTSVYCKAITPPSLGYGNVFDSNGSGRKIYVPAESIDVYKTSTYWSEYASAIEGYNF